MSVHAAIQYLGYRLTAKTRHGVHSPFVYAFIEQVLMNKQNLPDAQPPVQGNIALLARRYRTLLSRISNYSHPPTIRIVPIDDVANFISAIHTLHTDDVVVIPSIHTTQQHTSIWENLCSNNDIKLSIDLYGMGLLFFREEFKEQQHFVLRY